MSVAGASGDDVWLLTNTADLLHWNGHGVSVVARAMCTPTGVIDNSMTGRCAPQLDTLAVRSPDVFIGGSLCDSNAAQRPFVIRFRRGVPLACDVAPGMPGGTFSGLVSKGSVMWRYYYGRFRVLDGASVPSPSHGQNTEITSVFQLVSNTQAWIGEQSQLWRFNGVSWLPRPHAPFVVDALWEDEAGDVWAVGASGRQIARLRAGVWELLPVPPGFSAREVTGTSSRDVWYFGDSVFQWDGERYRRGPSPMPGVDRAWKDPSGAIWLLGCTTPNYRDTRTSVAPAECRGKVYRLPAPQGSSR